MTSVRPYCLIKMNKYYIVKMIRLSRNKIKFKNDFPALTPLSLENYEVQIKKNNGDLAAMLSLEIMEDQIFLMPKNPSVIQDAQVDRRLYPNPSRLVVKENNSFSNPFKLVMFRDSFTTELIPFMSEHFSKSIYVWDSRFNVDIIKREKPDVVIHELVERYLNVLLQDNPDEV